jgi:plasmid stability protein
MIQVRNVPDTLHRRLKARAAMAGMTLSDFLLAAMRKVAEKPTPEEMLLGTEAGKRLAPRVLSTEESRHAPHLLDAEVAQVVRRYWLAEEIDEQRGQEMLEDLAALPVDRHAHTIVLPRILELLSYAVAQSG